MLLAVRGEIHPGHDSDNEVSEALGDFFFAIWGAGSSPRDQAAHAIIPSQSTLLRDF